MTHNADNMPSPAMRVVEERHLITGDTVTLAMAPCITGSPAYESERWEVRFRGIVRWTAGQAPGGATPEERAREMLAYILDTGEPLPDSWAPTRR